MVAAAAAALSPPTSTLKNMTSATRPSEQAIAELSAKIGEKLELRRGDFRRDREAYLHRRSADRQRWVYWSSCGDDAAAAHAVANLEIAALRSARYLSRDDVPGSQCGQRTPHRRGRQGRGKPEQALPKVSGAG